LIIIGAGPAGITAAVYAARKNMSVLVITKDIGGQAAISGDVENYTGYQFITGPELSIKFEEHMRRYDIEVKENEEVIKIEKKGNLCVVISGRGSYQAKAIIIASGKRSKELNVPGEEEFKNKGLTYCATCDGPLFAQKDVAVIGGGNSALDAALGLINIVNKIYMINIASELTGDAIMIEKVSENKKVTILNNAQVEEILGDKMVSGIKITRENRQELLSVKGIFVEVGLVPNSSFAEELGKNEYGEIKVNVRNETNIQGIFAAGDVTDVPEKQIIIACGEGSKACLSAFKYLATSKF
ncbi:MAG: FAD-dependent oxidoreductase, partial [Candidatus Omnitrophica bacterium]|nr:FAD-dependent oxidoreductase [Candidatus Omnitrophota bacterium]